MFRFPCLRAEAWSLGSGFYTLDFCSHGLAWGRTADVIWNGAELPL